MTALPEALDAGERKASTRILSAIEDKRSGRTLTAATIEAIVTDIVARKVPDYQTAAWLATVACRGLDVDETVALTRAYISGGTELDLRSDDRPVVDKHSTGGVGDKVTLIVAATVAACGVRVAKMSGHGLGHAGGTLDKLGSIPGLRLDLRADEIPPLLTAAGMVITGQSNDLAPGDKATYTLRDATATVDSAPLIAASIMSKKLALRTDALVLDVKAGAGGLVPDIESANRLAELMLRIAHSMDRPCRAVISDMSMPLGDAVGNALEVREAIAVLRGRYMPRLSELCHTLSAMLLCAADPAVTADDADRRVRTVVADGGAYEQFVRWVALQGGDPDVIEHPERLPSAVAREEIRAREDGCVTGIDPRGIGSAALWLGAGRVTQHSTVDAGAGVLLRRRIGDEVRAGDVLAELHHNDRGDISAAIRIADRSFTVGAHPANPAPVVHQVW
ncbi:thymidine phosphorylase [Nocardia sp. Marseille-Q1738]